MPSLVVEKQELAVRLALQEIDRGWQAQPGFYVRR